MRTGAGAFLAGADADALATVLAHARGAALDESAMLAFAFTRLDEITGLSS